MFSLNGRSKFNMKLDSIRACKTKYRYSPDAKVRVVWLIGCRLDATMKCRPSGSMYPLVDTLALNRDGFRATVHIWGRGPLERDQAKGAP